MRLNVCQGGAKSVVSGTRIMRKISTRQWIAQKEEREGVGRVHAEMRTKCTNGLRNLLPKRIEMRESVACDIFSSLIRVAFPRFVAPSRAKRGVRPHSNGVRRKTDRGHGRENETR